MRENPHFPRTVCEASFSTLTLARISTVRVNAKAASITATAASVASPLPQASGASAKPSAKRSVPRDSRLIDPMASLFPLIGVITRVMSRPAELASRAA